MPARRLKRSPCQKQFQGPRNTFDICQRCFYIDDLYYFQDIDCVKQYYFKSASIEVHIMLRSFCCLFEARCKPRRPLIIATIFVLSAAAIYMFPRRVKG